MMDPGPPARLRGSHAIVIGGSMAGLLAARVLGDYYGRVTILERDTLDDTAEPRKRVPQGRHNHLLLDKGAAILEQLFPNLTADLIAAGAIGVDLVADLRWYHFGGHRIQSGPRVPALLQSRPLLEQLVRRRLKAMPRVVCRAACEVLALLTDATGARVTGVRVRPAGGGGAEETLTADLCVDATGRGSKSAAWLESLGYPPPEETAVRIDVGYASRIYRRQPEDLTGAKLLVTYPMPPGDKRMASLFPIEGERWNVTLGGWLGDHPPKDERGFLDFAQSLATPDIYRVLRGAEPLSDIAIHKFPASLRRHYEKLTRFPQGYLVIGDAVCSFNPIYGQGMTTAALQARKLADCLAEQRWRDDGSRFSRRFFRRIADVIEVPWLLATSEDFRYPAVLGKRLGLTALVNWYTAKLHRLSHSDAMINGMVLEVMNLNRSPHILLHPRAVLRVLQSGSAIPT